MLRLARRRHQYPEGHWSRSGSCCATFESDPGWRGPCFIVQREGFPTLLQNHQLLFYSLTRQGPGYMKPWMAPALIGGLPSSCGPCDCQEHFSWAPIRRRGRGQSGQRKRAGGSSLMENEVVIISVKKSNCMSCFVISVNRWGNRKKGNSKIVQSAWQLRVIYLYMYSWWYWNSNRSMRKSQQQIHLTQCTTHFTFLQFRPI